MSTQLLCLACDVLARFPTDRDPRLSATGSSPHRQSIYPPNIIGLPRVWRAETGCPFRTRATRHLPTIRQSGEPESGGRPNRHIYALRPRNRVRVRESSRS
ncbi:hypothetical protein ARMGADRAFT_731794 [Armillaria gallica]|uniref:Uncharacterized protein n=1 Tax=Armillaria gallica TaxID=47427 RepID=A0A2H3D2F2_ARMGA|nr:hypothetical protein ARMGADRAFT_731794 [Armillaria gallica]